MIAFIIFLIFLYASDTGKARYEIRNAGVANTVLLEPQEFEGAEFVVTSGDYDKLMEKVGVKFFRVIKYNED